MTQSKHLFDQTRTLILKSSTLSNGGVYVVPVRRSDPSVRGVGHLVDVPMCGLFAGRVFYHGDVVTLYGGTLMPCSSCSDTTHSRAIPDSDWVLSGLDWARAIRCRRYGNGRTIYMASEGAREDFSAFQLPAKWCHL